MSKTVKTWYVTAAFLVAFGLVLFVVVMATQGFDFTKLNIEKFETNTYEVSGTFDRIKLDVGTTEVEFVPSDDGNCRIVCYEAEKEKHSATVQDGTLVINAVDTRRWYEHIGFFIGTPKMTVYLPKTTYESLFMDVGTGDVAIPGDFVFGDLEIKGGTGDVLCRASVSNVMKIKRGTGTIEADGFSAGEVRLSTGTGAVKVNAAAVQGSVSIETGTGAVRLSDVTCVDCRAESGTGVISLRKVIASGGFSIENDTGDVKFEDSDAARIFVKTGTGSVTGSLLSDKVFLTETGTGSVSVPKTVTGGTCEIKTVTGDIKIEIR